MGKIQGKGKEITREVTDFIKTLVTENEPTGLVNYIKAITGDSDTKVILFRLLSDYVLELVASTATTKAKCVEVNKSEFSQRCKSYNIDVEEISDDEMYLVYHAFKRCVNKVIDSNTLKLSSSTRPFSHSSSLWFRLIVGDVKKVTFN
jgi:hypothetical protein